MGCMSSLCAVLLSSAAGTAPPRVAEILIDFGHDNLTSGGALPAWNDVTPDSMPGPFDLVDSSGLRTEVQLSFLPNETFGRVTLLGASAAVPGSELEGLGWPDTAISDGLYSSVTPWALDAEFTLSGLDPDSTYDFTLLASEMGASDQLATEYSVSGANLAAAILEPADNAADVVVLRGIIPDDDGLVEFRVRAATTNTKPERDFYLNAMRIEGFPAGMQPPLLGFSLNELHASRVLEKGPTAGSLSVYSSDAQNPLVTLSLLDDLTQAAPAWLSVPPDTVPDAAFTISFDPAVAGIGFHSATLLASAAGHAAASARITLEVRPQGHPENILFYGNSYLSNNATAIPELIELMAEANGFPEPNSVHRMALGKDTAFHANDPEQVEAISVSLPLGEEWDLALIQGGSLEATASAGNPAQFHSNVVQIMTNVRAHSPAARACLMQTWARASGHSIYSGANPTFASPLAMHQQIEAAYIQAEADLEAAFGPDCALRAAAGETAALLGFDPAYYGPDGSHPGPELSLTSAMTSHAAMRFQRSCDLEVDFRAPVGLGGYLLGWGFGNTEWNWLGGIADSVAEPLLRRYPGSGEDALLSTEIDGELSSCSLKELQPGDRITVHLTSPAGSYLGVPASIYLDLFPTGLPPGPYPPMPEIHYDRESAWVIESTAALGAGGLTAQVTVQPWMVGKALLIQALVEGPSTKTGNSITLTDAHEIRTGVLGFLQQQ
jgi:hypothetical protein